MEETGNDRIKAHVIVPKRIRERASQLLSPILNVTTAFYFPIYIRLQGVIYVGKLCNAARKNGRFGAEKIIAGP